MAVLIKKNDNLIPVGTTNVVEKPDDSLKKLIENSPLDLVIPSGTTGIRFYAFYGYTNLQSVVIPNTVTYIRGSAFQACSSLTSIIIPESVTSIGGFAFQSCSSLTSITIPSGVQSIGSNTFDGCSELTSITLQKTDGVVTLNQTNAIPATSTHHVTIYVPSDLISSYQTASNWSTLYNNGYITFSAIGGQNG